MIKINFVCLHQGDFGVKRFYWQSIPERFCYNNLGGVCIFDGSLENTNFATAMYWHGLSDPVFAHFLNFNSKIYKIKQRCRYWNCLKLSFIQEWWLTLRCHWYEVGSSWINRRRNTCLASFNAIEANTRQRIRLKFECVIYVSVSTHRQNYFLKKKNDNNNYDNCGVSSDWNV